MAKRISTWKDRARASLWGKRKKERKQELNRMAYASDPKRHQEYGKKWRLKNKEKRSLNETKRRLVSKLATPLWANKETMLCYYEFARLKSQMTGERWAVDHIVPLKSNLVCGLNTDYNLQVIRGIDNTIKANRVWPDMPVGV